jgi:general stress protein 26
MAEPEVNKLDDLIDAFETAMLVTRSTEGKLRARPMAIARHARGGELYFATRAEDGKLEEILQSPDVAVTMQDDGQYLSISGTARILTDRQLADDLWSESMRLWFPEGASDQQLTVILVEPRYAEFWDRTGLRQLEFLWEASKALLTARKASDSDLSGHGKVRMQNDS